MNQYVKIGNDVLNLEAISRISFVENCSGISDRIVIEVSGSEVIVDSALGGRARMESIRARLLRALKTEDWDIPEQTDRSVKAA